MNIEHIGLWVNDLEGMRAFYEEYFHAKAGVKYTNNRKRFESYFLTFESGARLELMTTTDLIKREESTFGYAHLAIKLDSKEELHSLVEQLVGDGFSLLNGPRTTGDGYYEAVVEDPENNLIELTI